MVDTSAMADLMDPNGEDITSCAVKNAVCSRSQQQTKAVSSMRPYDDQIGLKFVSKTTDLEGRVAGQDMNALCGDAGLLRPLRQYLRCIIMQFEPCSAVRLLAP